MCIRDSCCIAVLLAGCEEPAPEAIVAQANDRGKITDWQAESLSKVESLAELAGVLPLNGLTSITDQQAESLSKVKNMGVSNALQPLIDKYKKP